MVTNLQHSEPWMRERRFKDTHGRITGAEWVVYAKVSGKAVRLCAWDSAAGAVTYMKALAQPTGEAVDA